MPEDSYSDSFRKGRESAKIRGPKDVLIRIVLWIAPLAVALLCPVEWYWKIAIFVGLRFGIGFVIQAFALKRERRDAKND